MRRQILGTLFGLALFALGGVASPAKAGSVDEAVLQIELQWEPVEDAAGYHLEVSDDPEFHHLLKVVNGTGTVQSLELPRREKYYFRVAARDPDGELGPFAGSEFSVPVQKPSAGPAPSVAAKTAEADEAKKAEPVPRSVLRWYVPTQIFAGTGEWVRNEAVSGSDFNLSSGGAVPVISLGALKQVGAGNFGIEADLGQVSYIGRAFSSELAGAASGLDPASRRIGWRAGRLFWRGPVRNAPFPVTLGLEYLSQADFFRTGDDLLKLRQVSTIALMVGPTFALFSEGRISGDIQLLAELSPVGLARGAGILSRATFGYRRLWGPFSPQLQFVFHPSYYSISGAGRSFLRMDFGPSLLLNFAFEPPVVGEVEKLLEEPSG